MSRACYTVRTELRGALYRAVVDHAVRECATALLVVRGTLPLDVGGQRLLDRLRPHLRDESEASEWPGTRPFGGTALVFRYHLSHISSNVLGSAVDGLYGWSQPDLPEDLCFLRGDGEPWLVSMSHERDSYFVLDPDERFRLLAAVPEPGRGRRVAVRRMPVSMGERQSEPERPTSRLPDGG